MKRFLKRLRSFKITKKVLHQNPVRTHSCICRLWLTNFSSTFKLISKFVQGCIEILVGMNVFLLICEVLPLIFNFYLEALFQYKFFNRYLEVVVGIHRYFGKNVISLGRFFAFCLLSC